MDITVTIPAEEFGQELYKSVDKAVENLIAKDWQPIKHGRWLISSDGYYPYCSECGKEPQSRAMSDFCPNCGARMGGEIK